jgi:hypothetical protein
MPMAPLTRKTGTPAVRGPRCSTLLAAGLIAIIVGVTVASIAVAKPHRVVGVGQVRFNGHGPEQWAAIWRREHAKRLAERSRADDLQRRLTRRVLEARDLRRTLLHEPSSLEALRLASVVYHVSFDQQYRRASCESTGSSPETPPSERTLNAHAKNPTSWATGLLQILYSRVHPELDTWHTTPFAAFDPYSPYASALAGAWMEAHGRGGEWVCR